MSIQRIKTTTPAVLHQSTSHDETAFLATDRVVCLLLMFPAINQNKLRVMKEPRPLFYKIAARLSCKETDG